MKLDMVAYTAEYEAGVQQFNGRLQAKHAPVRFPSSHIPEWLPRQKSERVYQEFSLALDEEAQVRGAYILKHQEFLLNGRLCSIADYHLPISEAIVDPRYNAVGVRLLCDALRKQPRLFALGMGGYAQALPRMLQAMRWSIAPVPFLFHIVHPFTFCRNIVILRKSRLRKMLLDGLALTGMAWLAAQTAQVAHPDRRRAATVRYEPVETFDRWADDLWERAQASYALIAVRDSHVLNTLYPRSDRRFIRLRIERQGRAIGWAILLATAMSQHRHFGNMRVGTLVDCFADPADAADVVACARDALVDSAVDLIISNQSHTAWCEALRHCGFFTGPSNFLFAAAPELAEEFQPFAERLGSFHLNRGDGDGPIHL